MESKSNSNNQETYDKFFKIISEKSTLHPDNYNISFAKLLMLLMKNSMLISDYIEIKLDTAEIQIIDHQGDIYIKQVPNNNYNNYPCYGTIIFQNGDIYDGGIKNLSREGFGAVSYNDGSKYIGYFSNNLENGPGSLTKKENFSYDGNFTNGKYQGHGKATLHCGSTYSGNWFEGLPNGMGSYDNSAMSKKEFGTLIDWNNGIANIGENKIIKIFPNGNSFIGTVNGNNFVKGLLFCYDDCKEHVLKVGRWEEGEIQEAVELFARYGLQFEVSDKTEGKEEPVSTKTQPKYFKKMTSNNQAQLS